MLEKKSRRRVHLRSQAPRSLPSPAGPKSERGSNPIHARGTRTAVVFPAGTLYVHLRHDRTCHVHNFIALSTSDRSRRDERGTFGRRRRPEAVTSAVFTHVLTSLCLVTQRTRAPTTRRSRRAVSFSSSFPVSG
ncbi:hypothetical protein OG21DRAFT_98766 [Imleria badia]|nr:hypothetical protein OG21DRAFT_98766 [Imleria badia]